MKAIALLAFLTFGSACSWSTFDDLEGDTWVTSKGKPDNDSSNWGVAIQRTQSTGAGGKLAVIGANQTFYTELTVSGDGKVDVGSERGLSQEFGVGNLDQQPIMLADPATNEFALVTSSGSASIAVVRGAGNAIMVNQVFGPASPDAATYMVPPAPAAQMSQTLVAEGDKVFGTYFVNPQNPQPSCKLVDAANAQVLVRAMGAIPSATTNDVLVWSSTGKVLVYPSLIFNGAPTTATCATTGVAATATAAADTTVKPSKGSQILTFTNGADKFALLQGHDDTGSGQLALYNINATPTLVGTARTENGVKSAALLELDGMRYVIAGYPDAIVEGTSKAGQVQVFPITATGIGESQLLLHDAEPEGNQAFGRSVAAMPFGAKQLIIVGADNEVFTYFRTNLYAETRSGR